MASTYIDPSLQQVWNVAGANPNQDRLNQLMQEKSSWQAKLDNANMNRWITPASVFSEAQSNLDRINNEISSLQNQFITNRMQSSAQRLAGTNVDQSRLQDQSQMDFQKSLQNLTQSRISPTMKQGIPVDESGQRVTPQNLGVGISNVSANRMYSTTLQNLAKKYGGM